MKSIKIIYLVVFFLVLNLSSFAGRGGHIFLYNGTNHKWTLTKHGTDTWGYSDHWKMNKWNSSVTGKETIEPNDYFKFYFEYDRLDWDADDRLAEATYEIEGIGSFVISVYKNNDDYSDSWKIKIKGIDFELNGKKDHYFEQNFNQDGFNNFLITTDDAGNYLCNYYHGDASNWMTNTLGVIGDMALNEICIPASHDAAMSEIWDSSIGSNEGNTRTQSHDIGEQLTYGARQFDIRPIICWDEDSNEPDYRTGHFQHIGTVDLLEIDELPFDTLNIGLDLNGYFGSFGQGLDEIFKDINSFTSISSRKELIILNVSHVYNFSGKISGYFNGGDATIQQVQALVKYFQKNLTNLYIDTITHNSIATKNINEFVSSGSKVIILIPRKYLNSDIKGKGVFATEDFQFYNNYSNKEDKDEIVKDQIDKLKRYSSFKTFGLSWTRTIKKGIWSLLTHSIIDNAWEFNNWLPYYTLKESTPLISPNLLYIDNVYNNEAVLVSMILNRQKKSFQTSMGVKPLKPDNIWFEGQSDGHDENTGSQHNVYETNQYHQLFTNWDKEFYLFYQDESKSINNYTHPEFIDSIYLNEDDDKKHAHYDRFSANTDMNRTRGNDVVFRFATEFDEKLILGYTDQNHFYFERFDPMDKADAYNIGVKKEDIDYWVKGAFEYNDSLFLVYDNRFYALKFDPEGSLVTHGNHRTIMFPEKFRERGYRVVEVKPMNDIYNSQLIIFKYKEKNQFLLYQYYPHSDYFLWIKIYSNAKQVTAIRGEIHGININSDQVADNDITDEHVQVFVLQDKKYDASNKYRLDCYTYGITDHYGNVSNKELAHHYVDIPLEAFKISTPNLPLRSTYGKSNSLFPDSKEIWLWYPSTHAGNRNILTALVFGEQGYHQKTTKIDNTKKSANILNMEVYPNPVVSNSLLNLSTTILKDEEVKLEIYSSTGILQKTEYLKLNKGYNTSSIDLSNFNPGFYFINLRSNGGNNTLKFIVN